MAGIVLVRQKPGSAKGVMFVTVGDETGVAQGIIWAHRFEAQKPVIMSTAMCSLRGRLQKEGEVIHIITERVTDLTHELDSIGSMAFTHKPGRGDGVTHPGSPNRGDPGWNPKPKEGYYKPFDGGADPEDVVRVKSRDFK